MDAIIVNIVNQIICVVNSIFAIMGVNTKRMIHVGHASNFKINNMTERLCFV